MSTMVVLMRMSPPGHAAVGGAPASDNRECHAGGTLISLINSEHNNIVLSSVLNALSDPQNIS